MQLHRLNRVLRPARAVWATALLARANYLMAAGRQDDAFRTLRRLSLEQLAELLVDVPRRFTALKTVLPEMPSEDVQRSWTGNTGRVVLAQAAAFVRSVEKAFVLHSGRRLGGATILDYGCGWGRIVRFMYRFSPPSRIYGVDAWPEALEICRATRVLGNLALCDEVPSELPFPGVVFDLACAFSVFTHISEKTATAVMRALRPRIREGGLLALTVRPPTYWDVHAAFPPGSTAASMRERHATHGFAFLPHHRRPVDGDVTYGDTSIALDYIRNRWPEWDLLGHEPTPADPNQLAVFLRPRPR